MTLYHGSYKEITHPDIVHSRNNVDFGRGFYTTPLLEQAQKWSRKFKTKKRLQLSLFMNWIIVYWKSVKYKNLITIQKNG